VGAYAARRSRTRRARSAMTCIRPLIGNDERSGHQCKRVLLNEGLLYRGDRDGKFLIDFTFGLLITNAIQGGSVHLRYNTLACLEGIWRVAELWPAGSYRLGSGSCNHARCALEFVRRGAASATDCAPQAEGILNGALGAGK